jgi:hypothetical protein
MMMAARPMKKHTFWRLQCEAAEKHITSQRRQNGAAAVPAISLSCKKQFFASWNKTARDTTSYALIQLSFNFSTNNQIFEWE